MRERRALVVVSLRADFYGRLASYPRLAAMLSASHVLVGPMDRGELARAIEQPAARAGLEVERPLVEALVSDVAGEPGGLPLLSTTLLQLWRARDGRVLRYDSYRASGGVRGAVARLAEDAYNQLGEGERRIARGLMLRLASGEDGTLARRRVPLGELERIAGAGPVLAELTDARLLTVSDGEVELSHEALLREWPRYRAWLEEDRIGRRLHAHLTAAATDWDARGRDAADVYRGARLAAALEWRAAHEQELNQAERAFLEREPGRGRARAAPPARWCSRRSLPLMLVAVAGGVVALINQQRASNQARVALARQLGAQAVNEPRLDRAMLLAREAVNLDRSPQTEGTLLATLQRHPAVIGTFALPVDLASQLAVSPDGRTLAVSHFRRVRRSSREPGRHPLLRPAHARAATSASAPLRLGAEPPVYSSDGSLLAYPTDNELPSIAVRDAHTLARLATLTFDPLQTARLAPDIAHASILIAPDGRTAYCAYRVYDLTRSFAKAPGATYLARWSLPSGRRLSTTRIDPGAVLAVRLTDAGARLLVVDAHSVSTFDASPVRRLSSAAITPAPAAPSAAAISPDGSTIAVGSPTGQVSFVDPSTGHARPGTGAHSSAVTSLTYSPDGRAVASTGTDNKVIIWDPQAARPAQVLTAPAEQVQYVAFSPDGTTLYTSSLGGVLLAWDLTGDRSFGRRFPLGAGSPCCRTVLPPAPPLAVSPDGSTFAVRLGTSTVGLFSAHTLHQQASFTIGPKGTMITALAWSPTRPVLAVAGYSGLVQLWRVDGTPRPARSLTGLHAVPGAPEAIQALTFSPDGQLLAASDSSRTDTQGIVGADLAHYDATFRGAGDLASEHRQTSGAEGSRDRPRSLRCSRVLPRREAPGRKPPGWQRPDPRPHDRSGPADTSSARRRRDGLAGVRTQRDPRDRHPGRDRPAVEPGQRRSNRGPRGRGRRPGHQHRVRPHRPAVRDHRRSGRNGQAVVQLNASARRHRAQHRTGRRCHRRVRARRQAPARRRRPRQRLHLADVARRLGATRMHGRRTQPDPRGMDPIPPRTSLHAGLPLKPKGTTAPDRAPTLGAAAPGSVRTAFAQRHKPRTHDRRPARTNRRRTDRSFSGGCHSSGDLIENRLN